jgi:hypothetical protein
MAQRYNGVYHMLQLRSVTSSRSSLLPFIIRVSSIATNTFYNNTTTTASSLSRLGAFSKQFTTTAPALANMANNNDSFKLESVFNVLVIYVSKSILRAI